MSSAFGGEPPACGCFLRLGSNSEALTLRSAIPLGPLLVISDNGNGPGQMKASWRKSRQIFSAQEESHEIRFPRSISMRRASVFHSGAGPRIQGYAGREQDRLLREGVGGPGG